MNEMVKNGLDFAWMMGPQNQNLQLFILQLAVFGAILKISHMLQCTYTGYIPILPGPLEYVPAFRKDHEMCIEATAFKRILALKGYLRGFKVGSLGIFPGYHLRKRKRQISRENREFTPERTAQRPWTVEI
jgi:hypothetical protein